MAKSDKYELLLTGERKKLYQDQKTFKRKIIRPLLVAAVVMILTVSVTNSRYQPMLVWQWIILSVGTLLLLMVVGFTRAQRTSTDLLSDELKASHGSKNINE